MQIGGAYRLQQQQAAQGGGGNAPQQGNFQNQAVLPALPQVPQPGGQAQQPPTGPDPAKYKQLMKASPTVNASAGAKAAMKSGPTVSDRRLLLDPKTLKAEMGRDTRFIGSDRYKAVLSAVKEYNAATRQQVASDGATRQQQVATLTAAIDKAIARIDEHVRAHADQPMIALKNELQNQKAILDDIGHSGPPPNTTPSFKEMLAARALGMPDDAYHDFDLHNQGTERRRQVLGSGNVNTAYKVEYAGVGDKVFKAMTTRDAHMPGQAAQVGIDAGSPRYANRNVATYEMSRALGLDLIPKSGFASHGDQFGLVMDLVQGHSPQDSDPRPLPLSQIDRNNIKNFSDDVGQPGGPQALVDWAKGAGFEVRSGEWEKHATIADQFSTANNPALTLKLVQLEWLDNLCGQVDRHPGNYMIDQSGAITLKGIDNDYSFGRLHNDPSQPVGRLNGLPPLIDGDTAQAIRTLQANWDQPGGMKGKLEGLKLTGPEVTATKARLDALVNHINTLQQQGNVVPTNQWGTWQDGNGASAHAIVTQGPSYVSSLDQIAQGAYQQKHAAGLA